MALELVRYQTSYSDIELSTLLFIVLLIFQNEHYYKCITYILISLHTLLRGEGVGEQFLMFLFLLSNSG